MVPSVQVTIDCVSPRWKKALPCVRGRTETSMSSLRIWSLPRPSGRMPWFETRSWVIFFSRMRSASLASLARLSAACQVPKETSPAGIAKNVSSTYFLTSSTLALRSFLPLILRASFMASYAFSLTSFMTSSEGRAGAPMLAAGAPHLARSSSIISRIGLTPWS